MTEIFVMELVKTKRLAGLRHQCITKAIILSLKITEDRLLDREREGE